MTDPLEPGLLGLMAFHDRFARWADQVGSDVVLLKSWSDTPTSFCILYRYGTNSSTLGFRAEWEPGEYDSVERWGEEMSDEVNEPLGTLADSLVSDGAGVLWWGAVGTGIPVVPPGGRQQDR